MHTTMLEIRGFYIKAGQSVASMHQVPKEFVSTLSVLQDKASFWSFKDLEVVFLEEFGKDVKELFEAFDEQPIAAASLAQVHRGFLKNGQEVAVKVQYPGLQKQFATDIATMAFLSKALAWIFPDYQFEWLVGEFEKNVVRELDFTQEADNADRTAKSFAHNRNVRIPRIFRELSTKRVLTMEFMEGCKIDDIKSLEKAGVDPKEVASLLAAIFAEMIFCHGFVHGDPHPGNLLVHRDPSRSGKHNFDIVILDHGLYRELGEKFRTNYCRLWRALILLDADEISETGRNLGAGQYARYLPVIFTGRAISSNLVRSIAYRLGATRKTCLMAYVKNAVSGLSLGHPGSPDLYEQGLLAYTKAKFDYANLRIRLEFFEFLIAAYQWYGALSRLKARIYCNLSLKRLMNISVSS
uniref:Protein kinase domain-containing protein n=1 Tax=Physcomitrium patens TaxID=3218 RepID=A0A7I4ALG2_PHYPA